MATSAKSEVKCGYNGHYHLYMTITVNSQDIANNRSNVTVKMYAKSDSSSYGAYNLSSSANTVKMTVNGSQVVNKTMAMDFRNKATVNLASWTGNISHGSDGTKTLSCSGSFTISGSSYLSGGNISASIALDAIPRSTVPTLSAGSVAIGSALTIKLSPAVSGWTHKLYYKYGSNSRVQLATSAGNYNWTLPTSLASYLPSATSGTLTIEVDTYNGSTKIGSTQSVTVTMTVPASMVPSISSVAVSEAGTGLSGLYVQGKSKFRIKTTAAGINGSSIASITHKVGSSTYTASADYTTGVINSSGTVAIVTTVKDSRGRTASKTTNVTVYAYSPPQITAFQAIRSNSAGAANNNGTYGKISAAFAISSVNSKNANSYKIEYRQSGAASWTSLKTGTGYSYSGDTITGSVFSVANTYEIRLTVTDSFTSATATIQLSTAFRLLSYIIAKSALAMGKIAELANIFEVAMETIFRKNIGLANGVYLRGETSSGSYANILGMNSSGQVELDWTSGGLKGRVRKKLWSGTLTSGSLTIPDLPYYNVFLLEVYTNAADTGNTSFIPVYRTSGGSALHGIGVTIYASGGVRVLTATLSVSGTTLNYSDGIFMLTFNESSFGRVSGRKVLSIYGLL